MARFGIGYQEVENAAQELQAQGINPTVENIRKITGTGSNGTIATHLRAWRAKHSTSQDLVLTKHLPQELVSTMTGLWDQVTGHAKTQIQAIKETAADEISIIKSQLEGCKKESAQWQQSSQSLKQEKDILLNDKLTQEQAIIELKKQNALQGEKQNSHSLQLQGMQNRIDELNHLHKQAQINLEHYHESSRQQRLLEQQRFEQQQHQLTQTINQLEQKLMAQQLQYTQLDEKYHQMCQEKEGAQKSNDSLRNQVDKIHIQLIHAEKERDEKMQALNQLQTHVQTLQEKLNAQSSVNNDFQKQIAVLSQQLLTSQNEAKELSGQNKSLAHDKWILGQEKAQLEGQLKQVGTLLQKQAIT